MSHVARATTDFANTLANPEIVYHAKLVLAMCPERTRNDGKGGWGG